MSTPDTWSDDQRPVDKGPGDANDQPPTPEEDRTAPGGEEEPQLENPAASPPGKGPARKVTPARAATCLVCATAGFMLTVGSIASSGKDLRPNRSTDLVELVQAQSARKKELSSDISRLRKQVDDLSASRSDQADALAPQLAKAAEEAGLSPVKGPAIQVSLSDAPLEIKPAGVAGDLLVVHQQDIQAVANALWAGGAEAMTIQGVRVTSTTGIKCVGNSVVLHGIPYAPPYVITAIGSQQRLEQSLANSNPVQIYKQYVSVYSLKYEQRRVDLVEMPGFQGSIELQHAKPVK